VTMKNERFVRPNPTVCCDCGWGVGESNFFSRRSGGYVCDSCLSERAETRPVVCPVCGGEDEHTFGSLLCEIGGYYDVL
jgi:hypothetical protein